MNRTLAGVLTACLVFLGLLPLLRAETIVIEGNLESRVRVSKQMKWGVERPLSQFSVMLPLPINYSNKGVSQGVEGLRIEYDPQPAAIEDETDPMGNIQKKITWNNVAKDVHVNLAFEVRIKAGLPAMESGEPFPLRNVKGREKAYLRPTTQVQSASPEIISLSKELTRDTKTEHEAATLILNYVADSVKYTYNPPRYDALYTLGVRAGNCTNISHLSIALLRAAGIPARIVGGTTLDKQWKIPINNERHIVHSMGRGGHAWIEIFFPDLGWLAYDPQQSRQFTSTRHIKEMHGLDFMNISITWSGLPYLPAYSQVIDAQFLDDVIDIRPKSTAATPKLHLVSNQVVARADVAREDGVQRVDNKPEKGGLKRERLVPGKPADAALGALTLPLLVKPESTLPAPARPSAVFEPPPAEEESAHLLPEPPRVPLEPLIPSVKSEKSPAAPDVKSPASLDMKSPAALDASGPALPDMKSPAALDASGPALPDMKSPASPDVKRAEGATSRKSTKERVIEFGNMEFPALVEAYRVEGDRAIGVLDAETAEYVTSRYVYAQALTVKEATTVKGISLAMHKFGGDGSVYVDLVSDDNGKPALEGVRSLPVFLENIERKHGYYWVDFVFSRDHSNPVLTEGKHWIILRHSGEAIMSWFYTPGKWYSGGYDTRSTSRGHRWEDVLNYDFVFKVTALVTTATP